MIVQSCGSGTGYLEVPLHVLYKNEYIESAYANIQRKSMARSLLDNCKENFIKIYVKLKDFFISKFGVRYQREYILNNVDKKTKTNLICYIKSLNLNVKEYYDQDNTKVIEVDIAPIKNKPEMNDLLVYIENEKIKITRREERGRSNEFSESGKWSTEHNLENYGARTSKRNRINLNNSVQFKLTRKRIEESIKRFEKENKLLFPNEMKQFHSCGAIPDKSRYKKIEDPLTKAEKRIKSQLKSRSNIQKRNVIKTNIEDKNNSDTNNKLKDGIMSSLMNSDKNGIGVYWNAEKVKYNNTDINMITRAKKLKEESINIIKKLSENKNEKRNELENNNQNKNKIKEEQVFNKLGEEDQLYNKLNEKADVSKGEEHQLSKTEMKQNENKEISVNILTEDINCNKNVKTEIPLIELKNNEPYMHNGVTSDPNFKPEIKETTNEDLFKRTESMAVNVDKKENTKKKRKFSRFIKKIFKKKSRKSKKDKIANNNINSSTESNRLTNKNTLRCDNNQINNKEIEIVKDIICNTALTNVFNEHNGDVGFKDDQNQLFFVPCKKEMKKYFKKGQMDQEIWQDQKNITEGDQSNIEKFDSLNKNKTTLLSNKELNQAENVEKKKIEIISTQICNLSNNTEITNNQGANRSSLLSNKELLLNTPTSKSNIQNPTRKFIHTKEKDICNSTIKLQTNKELSFNWKKSNMKTTRIDRNKKLSVIEKLYNKLKISSKDLSDSEETSSSENWADKTRNKNDYELSWSSLGSYDGERSSSADTVQSVTDTVIKKLAKRPKKKRK